MNISCMRFPRQLEADHRPDVIRQVLTARRAKLWSGGDLQVPVIAMTDRLEKAFQSAVLKGQIRWGLEGISEKLCTEKEGIANVRERGGVAYGERISRLIMFSNDGAERFYRHVERLLQSHAPRVLGCLLDVDSRVLGKLITGKDSQVKAVMAEHKDAVSGILRSLLDELPSD